MVTLSQVQVILVKNRVLGEEVLFTEIIVERFDVIVVAALTVNVFWNVAPCRMLSVVCLP